jgi:purine-binding chemotaxis protein CheW
VSAKNRKAMTGKNLVGFEVGGILYAMDIRRVREIVRPMSMLDLPQLPESVIGVCDHRGDVVPVIDLRRRFDVPPAGKDRDVRWVIVTRGTRLIGLVVDRVTEVFGTLESESRELPQMREEEAARVIRGAYAHAGRLVFVLDVDALTSAADRIALPDLAKLGAGTDGAG